ERGEALGSPLLSPPVRSRTNRQDRSAGRDQRGRSAIVARCRPQLWAWWRVEPKQPGELAHSMLANVTLSHHPTLACPQQPGKRRAPPVDDQVPTSGRHGGVERHPMCRPAPLLDYLKLLQF